MRLYLSSFRLGNRPERLVELVGGNRRAAVVLNACDFMSDEDRTIRVGQETAALAGLGFEPEELDLREYFAGRAGLAERLASCGLVWIRGGNTFVLRQAMLASGFDLLIRDLLLNDAIVYGGFSAACVVLGPTLDGVELVDDPDVVPTGYDPAVIRDGLGLIPYAVAPHWRSEHPESADVERLVEYWIEQHVPFVALRDGEVIVVDGEHRTVVS